MDFYLVTPDNTDYNIRYDGSGYFTLAETLPDGIGYPPVDHLMTLSAYRDGGRLNAIRYRPRVVDVTVITHANSVDTLMTALKRVYTASKPSRIALVPSKIKAVANAKTAYLDVYYTGEVVRQRYNGREAEVTLRFVAYNPQWYYSSLNTQALTLNGTVNLPYIARRSAAANSITWDNMGGGANGNVYTFAQAGNGDIYVGGYFTQIGGVSANNIARYSNGNWYPLGGGNSTFIGHIVVLPNGNVVASSYEDIQLWNGSSWSLIGSVQNPANLRKIVLDALGRIFAIGSFTSINSVSANYIAYYENGNWYPVGTGLNGVPTDIVSDDFGNVYVCGSFTQVNGVNAQYVAKISVSDTITVTPLSSPVLLGRIAIDKSGRVFGAYGGASTGPAMLWNGSAWKQIGELKKGNFSSVTVLSANSDENGLFYVAGRFGFVNDVKVPNGVAVYNGYRWRSIDVSLSGSPSIYAVNMKLGLVGFDTNGASSLSAYTTSVTNNGSPVKPVIEVNGKCTLQSIFNETTGKRLWFDVTLQAGEKLTIDCEKLTITSSWRGNLLSALVPGSNFADFVLQPGANNITVFATDTSGASASIKWYNRYDTLAEAVG